jgi:hypothetical protein
MKRSELQIEICKLLEAQSVYGAAYMFKAQQIIELIEKCGMVPRWESIGLDADDKVDTRIHYEWFPEGVSGHYAIHSEDFDALVSDLKSDKGPSEQVLKAREKFLELKEQDSNRIVINPEQSPNRIKIVVKGSENE